LLSYLLETKWTKRMDGCGEIGDVSRSQPFFSIINMRNNTIKMKLMGGFL